MKKFLPILCAVLALFVLTACGAPAPKAADGRPVVAVSIVPQETFVKAICGDAVNVVVMVPPGASPENYEPTPIQMEEFSDADVYFAIGVPAEEQSILPVVSDSTKVVDLSAKAAEVYPELYLGEHRDPHVWLSIKRVKVMIDAMTDELSALLPDQADAFAANAEAYLSELEEADADIAAAMADAGTKGIVVYHPAFGYFCDDYGIDMYALEDEGKEATPKHLTEVIDLAHAEGIEVIFYQAEIDRSQALAFAEEIDGEAVMLEPLSADYIANMHKMAEAIREATR